MTSGFIFDIQRFSVKDGPGIRTTVFLKGCNLRCNWCHNPESIRPWQELQYFSQLCVQCGACAEICPCHTVKNGEHRFDRSTCNLCGACAKACTYDALRMAGRSMTAEAVMDIVRKDVNYYKRSGGGLTLSGGEPLEQVDFAAAIFQQARQEGIHTALDTAGNVPFSRFEAVLPYVNLVLLDIKNMDPVRHAFYSGSDNSQILANARQLFERKIPMHIRVPVIPGINDDESSLEQIRAFVSNQPSVQKIEFLPYHDLGLAKAASLA